MARGRAGLQGCKHKITLAIPVGCQLPCCDNSGAKLLNVIAVTRVSGVLNRYPAASLSDILVCSVRKGKPELRKKTMTAVVVRQRKAWRRKDGTSIYCEENAGIILTQKGDVKASGINGPVAKECADLWPKIATLASSVV